MSKMKMKIKIQIKIKIKMKYITKLQEIQADKS